jgi:hypothetical protein
VFLPFFVHRVFWFHKAAGLEGRERVLNRRLASRKPPLDYPAGSLLILPAVVTRRLLASGCCSKSGTHAKPWTLSRDSLGLCPAGGVSVMAARANWKGYLRLSLVSCPVALFPATTESEKIRFHQLHKQTGNRIRYRKVDDERRRDKKLALLLLPRRH